MGRTDLTLIISVALVVAVIIGWVLRVFFDRLKSDTPVASDEALQRMQEAEAARADAEEQLEETTTNARNREHQLQSELDAAMAGLGNARREAEAWQREAEAWRKETDEVRHDHEK